MKQEGGNVELNVAEIGRNSSTGLYHIHSGSFIIARGNDGASLFLGTDSSKTANGNGTFRISSGSFTTRTGVYLGSPSGGIGRFEVIGSYPSLIGIGSQSGIDGSWIQNAGSTLSVRIDKTPQGVTPVFVDDVDDDDSGDGDVTFESGALLDVGFTAAFHNGGTFTVMEWEGDVTDNGLQFAPTVDTNIWSFRVDAANKRLTVTATGAPIDRSFVHPGLSHKLSDLERMRDMVNAGIEPYASTFESMRSSSRARFTYEPGTTAEELEANGGTPNNNAMRNDGVAAYYNALMWFITGDERHAEAAIRIFTLWSGVRNIDGIPLDAGRHWRIIEAAEIIKSTYDGWAPEDIQAFGDMLVFPGYSNTRVPNGDDLSLYWKSFQGDPKRHGNQGLFAMRVVMAIGVFLDNEIIYDRAARYIQGAPAREDDIPYVSGPSIQGNQIGTFEHFDEFNRNGERNTIADYGYNEVIHNYIFANGQGQESSRDQVHAVTGNAIIMTMSEMAWTQGDDIYGYLDNRPLLGMEYQLRYNLSADVTFPDQPTPWDPKVENGQFLERLDRSGRFFSKKINPFLVDDLNSVTRGNTNLQPNYEMNLAHYRDRLGLPGEDTIWLQRGLDYLVDEIGFEGQGTPWDFPSYGGLTFRRTSPGDPVQGFSNGTPDFAMNTLPATIQAENFDYFPIDGEGHTYSDTTPANSGVSYRLADAVDLTATSEGGFAISDIGAGEWVTYTVSPPAAGSYDIIARYASSASGGTIQFSLDGSDVSGQVSVPHGGSASTGASDWKDMVIATDVPLSQGVQQLRIDFGGTSDSFLLNSFSIQTPAIEDWRVTHFRTPQNDGIALDTFDADKDGLSNLLEYAIGQDPLVASRTPALVVSNSTENPGDLEIVFDRISDPTLTYEVQRSETLLESSWVPVVTIAGQDNDTIVIPESLSPDVPQMFFRLHVSR